jgi:hypothetical protein
MGQLLERGHSRVPVYIDSPSNPIGVLLVGKRVSYSLLSLDEALQTCFMNGCLMSKFSAFKPCPPVEGRCQICIFEWMEQLLHRCT